MWGGGNRKIITEEIKEGRRERKKEKGMRERRRGGGVRSAMDPDAMVVEATAKVKE